jgi:hypothetical protein
VVGTASVIAIIGNPATLAQALDVSDQAYAFGALAGVLSGVAALALRPDRGSGAAETDVRTMAGTGAR